MTIRNQLDMLKEIAFYKDEWIIQIVFTHKIQGVYGTKECTQGLCASYLTIMDIEDGYNWDKCDIVQVTIYTNVSIIPIMSINGMKLSDFIKILKEV